MPAGEPGWQDYKINDGKSRAKVWNYNDNDDDDNEIHQGK